MACVVLKPGIVRTADELVAYCRQGLATFKIRRRVEFLETELPKSGSRKILRRNSARPLSRSPNAGH
jgi:acyl-CoA synthetase (AMP-forming)/AMP-acid ligase II